MRIVLTLVAVLLATAAAGAAPDEAVRPLGGMHLFLELDAMWVQHRTFETDDAGLYGGFGGYGHLGRGWYGGAEIGTGASVTILGINESRCTSYEFNVKRAHAFSSDWAGTLGAGLSYCRAVFEEDDLWSPGDGREITDSAIGGQVFGEFMLTGSRFFLAVKAEYQLTADFDAIADVISPEEGWDYSNLRIGVQIGLFGWR